MPMGKGKKISLENYLDFIESHHQSDLSNLTVNYLEQIIKMHGFRRVIGPKNTVMDAVKTINPMDPSRSTLKDGISSRAFITLEEANADLAELNWQECCVTSVLVFNSRQENFSTHELALQSIEQPNAKSRSKSKSKSRTIVDANPHGLDGSSTSTCSSAIGEFATKQVAKKKRIATTYTKGADDLGSGTNDTVAQSGTLAPYLCSDRVEWRTDNLEEL